MHFPYVAETGNMEVDWMGYVDLFVTQISTTEAHG